MKVLSRPEVAEPAFVLFVPEQNLNFVGDIMASFQLENLKKELLARKHIVTTADLDIAGAASYQGPSMHDRATDLLEELVECHRLFVYGSRVTAFARACIQTAIQNGIHIKNLAVEDSQLDRHIKWFVR